MRQADFSLETLQNGSKIMYLTDWDKLSEGEKFKETFRSIIKRPGAGDLLKHLELMGFFEAPASTKYHGAYPGGLVEHSNNVFRRLVWLNADEKQKGKQSYSAEHIAVVALLHDICKAQSYKLERTATGQQYVYAGDALPVGHGEKSVIMIQPFMDLDPMEIIAIRWHMGAYDAAARSDLRELDTAFKQCKLAAMLHLADMTATHLDEREG